MKAYKVELLVLDFEDVGEEDIKNLLNCIRYIHPTVMSIEGRDIGEWSDDNPLNLRSEQKKAFRELFK